MLVEFRVENHRSIKEEQILSMETSRFDGEKWARTDGDASLLPVAALYGANASGKSNVLLALQFMREAVIFSHRFWPPDEGIPREPFAWGPSSHEPSLFEIRFTLDRVPHEYGFVADDNQFLEEWLYVWPNGRKQVWFEREGSDFKFGENLKGENQVAEKVTRPNGLFLSAAVQNRHELLEPIFGWFRSLRTYIAHSIRRAQYFDDYSVPRWLSGDPAQQSLFPDPTEPKDRELRVEQLKELLRAADVGILDFRIEIQEDTSPRTRSVRRRNRVLLQHRSGIPDAWLPLEEESHGTRQIFRLAPMILDALIDGNVLVIDELESSFHPLLALHLVKTFNDPAKNPRNAQLIFSTHDTNLLGSTLGEPSLRRDQVWLTEKDEQGTTRIYPLTNFKPRKEENLERGYLQGRYGAIPFLGSLPKKRPNEDA